MEMNNMNRSELRKRTGLMNTAVKALMENPCSLELVSSLIDEDINVRMMVQKTLSDFADLGCEPTVELPCHLHVTVHPSLLQGELAENAQRIADHLDEYMAATDW